MSKTKIILVTISLLMYGADIYAQKGVGKITGIARKSSTPEIINLIGKVREIKIGPCKNTTGPSSSGTHLVLETNKATIANVHLGPTNQFQYIRELKAGTDVQVIVFRTEDLPENNFVAKELTIHGETHILRDENLKPVWSGRGRNKY